MIYFLINNDYHYFDFELHAPALNRDKLHLIEIPHTLARRDSSRWARQSRFERILSAGFARTFLNHWRTARLIRRSIIPTRDDVLFLYTEHEPLNQYVVDLFRRAGARVYMIEDGGIATYITFRNPDSEPLRPKERLLRALYRCLPGGSHIRLQKIGGNLCLWMPDGNFDAVCLYRSIAIRRKIPVILLHRPAQARITGASRHRILFLNQDLYAFNYLSANEYTDMLSEVLAGLSAAFEQVLFKFHPRESDPWRQRITQKVLSRWPTVVCLTDNQGIEATVEQYGVGLAASFNSTALMNLVHRGIEPVFLFHLFPLLTRHADFRENTVVLAQLGYSFVDDVRAVTPDYRCGLADFDSVEDGRCSIGDIVAMER